MHHVEITPAFASGKKKCLYIFIIYIDMYYIYILCLLLLLLSFLMSDYASLVLF